MAASALGAALRGQLRFVLAVVGGAALLLVFLVVVKHARLDGATIALVAVGIALVTCLRALYRIVHALSRADLDTMIEQAGEIGSASERELREERRRLLRALNELRFDHEMGKLSTADYDAVRAGYELRAIEVMRRLDASRGLHPELARVLGREAAAGEPAPESEVPTEVVVLPSASRAEPEAGAEAETERAEPAAAKESP